MGFVIKTSSYSCIEVNDKHWVCSASVMAQTTEYLGIYGNSQLRCDVTQTSRMFVNFSRDLSGLVSQFNGKFINCHHFQSDSFVNKKLRINHQGSEDISYTVSGTGEIGTLWIGDLVILLPIGEFRSEVGRSPPPPWKSRHFTCMVFSHHG